LLFIRCPSSGAANSNSARSGSRVKAASSQACSSSVSSPIAALEREGNRLLLRGTVLGMMPITAHLDAD